MAPRSDLRLAFGSGRRMQLLWGGYGEIVRVTLPDGCTAVMKAVIPPAAAAGDVGHARKCRSYEVELTFYERYAPLCSDVCRVPRLLAAQREGIVLVLEDLDAAGFRRRAGHEAVLGWLAAFHARFLGHAPEGLWPVGTYWHLGTRRDELVPELAEEAALFDAALEGVTYRTLVHGDAKLPNFCARDDGRVAAVDFQYVGGGCGMRDVAYLLAGSADALLDVYFERLRAELGARGVDAAPVEAEWRPLYRVACADFHRFLAGWAPREYARDAQAQKVVHEVAADLRRSGGRR